MPPCAYSFIIAPFTVGIVSAPGRERQDQTQSIGRVLTDSTGRGVHADFLGHRTGLDAEREAKPAAAALAFELLVGDPAWMRFPARSRAPDRS